MDKLEKALEKARQQRSNTLASSASAAATPAPNSAGLTPSTLPAGTADVQVSDAHLEQNRVLAFRSRNAEADIFRLLRTQVLQAMNNANFRTLAITSANYGDGKTTIAINLAISMALDLKQTVLLADLDLRKPSVAPYLGISPEHGLTDYLIHGTPLPDCLVRLPFDRLTTLPAGKLLENSSETLGSPRMNALASELKSRYPDRFIIYDMPPILAQDDALAFMPNVDAALLVVQDGVTKTSEVKRCLAALENYTVLGTVLNNIT